MEAVEGAEPASHAVSASAGSASHAGSKRRVVDWALTYRNYDVLCDSIDAYSRGWRFYFFAVEFCTVPSCGLALLGTSSPQTLFVSERAFRPLHLRPELASHLRQASWRTALPCPCMPFHTLPCPSIPFQLSRRGGGWPRASHRRHQPSAPRRPCSLPARALRVSLQGLEACSTTCPPDSRPHVRIPHAKDRPSRPS